MTAPTRTTKLALFGWAQWAATCAATERANRDYAAKHVLERTQLFVETQSAARAAYRMTKTFHANMQIAPADKADWGRLFGTTYVQEYQRAIAYHALYERATSEQPKQQQRSSHNLT